MGKARVIRLMGLMLLAMSLAVIDGGRMDEVRDDRVSERWVVGTESWKSGRRKQHDLECSTGQ